MIMTIHRTCADEAVRLPLNCIRAFVPKALTNAGIVAKKQRPESCVETALSRFATPREMGRSSRRRHNPPVGA